MLTCPECQTGNEDGKKFCKMCGAALIDPPAMRYCRECNLEYESEKKFCIKCGRPLTSGPPPDIRAQSEVRAKSPTDAREGTRKPLRWAAMIAAALLLVISSLILLKCIVIFIQHGPLHFSYADIPMSWLMTFVALVAAAAAIFVLRRTASRRT